MLGNFMRGVTTPLWIYGVTALVCWLVPTRLSVDGETVLNVYPAKALALVTVSLGIAYASLALRGGMEVLAAGCWAVATLSLVTVFAVSHSVAPSTWSGIIFVQTLAVGTSACVFGVLAWQLARRRVATGASMVARGSVAFGIVMLAYNYAALVLRQAGVLRSPVGIEHMAELTASLTVDLWISSVFLVVGAASHAARR